jgi:DNA-binding NarL/FixJ family response regulator
MIKAVVIHSQKEDLENIVSLLSADGDIKVLASGKDGYDAIKLIGSLKPDIAILDNHLEFIKGEQISPVLKLHSPLTAVIILVTRISDTQLLKAASNKVSGLVHTDTDLNILPRAVRLISKGGCCISPALASRVLRLLSLTNPGNTNKHSLAANKSRNRIPAKLSIRILSGENPTENLSRMELRVLAHIGEGLTSDEIAEKLHLTVGTVRNYVSSVMRKTGLRNRSQMARYALCCGIVSLNPE